MPPPVTLEAATLAAVDAVLGDDAIVLSLTPNRDAIRSLFARMQACLETTLCCVCVCARRPTEALSEDVLCARLLLPCRRTMTQSTAI